jgi:capsular polysaccharide biosynthesis protein
MLGVEYFGHWLKDDCTQYLLAEEHGALSVPPLYTPAHQSLYESYFSQRWTPVSRARIDHLIVYQDFSQNSLKRRRYQVLTSRIRAQLVPNSPALVYLKRGTTGVARLVANEGEIIEALVKKGFVVVDIASDRLETIITSLMEAKIVVTVEGSHFWHCWFSPENRSGVITLQPPDRFTSIAKGWLDAVSARFGLVVGEKREGASWFSISDILKTVDLMASDLARSGNQ